MRNLPLLALIPLTILTGCEDEEMGLLEALAALDEVNQSSRGEAATSEVIEISTDFTIGGALQDAAQAVADFWESQADCAEVSVQGNVTTIDYGTLEDSCTWQGRTYAGVNTVTIQSTTPGELQLLHDWAGFTNGDVTVDGGATVTWSGNDLTRRVQTEHTWTDTGGAQVDVVGDHISGRIDEDKPVWESGFTLDGTRDWTSDSGDWTLEMTDLELRLVDPAPQAGSIDLINPANKSLTILYERVDEDTIQATLQGLRGGDRVYHIDRLGIPEEI
ncbi:MAG TPA: hypothetical protein ENK18_21955 [Deltaproteobacteria bacterium]|nr:hypothetical protein [Deltaproteobacteria bacterium]